MKLRYVLRRGAELAVIGLGLLSAATSTPAAENLIEPGQWKVTSTTVINGAVQPAQAKGRCISAEQAADVTKTFGPVSGTINSTCDAPDIKTTGRTLSWRLKCRGRSMPMLRASSTSTARSTTLRWSPRKVGWREC